MSNKSKASLTENGVRILFDVDQKAAISMQVVFLSFSNSNMTYYLRLSDGRHVSPIVALLEKHFNPTFYVGAVISVKAVKFDSESNERENRHYLEDKELSLLFIKSYTLLETHEEVGSILGSVSAAESYRDAIRHILPVLKNHDHNFRFIEKNIKIAQAESNKLREQGNNCFSNHDYVDATVFYDAAKGNDPLDYRLWCNSSHAHFQLEEYSQAEEDAVVGMKLNPFFGKAYYRAGQAALKLGKNKDAASYGSRGKFLCSNVKDLQHLIDEANKPLGNKDHKVNITALVMTKKGSFMREGIDSAASALLDCALSNASSIEIYKRNPQGHITTLNTSGSRTGKNSKKVLSALMSMSDDENVDPNDKKSLLEDDKKLKKALREKNEKQVKKKLAAEENRKDLEEKKKKEEKRREEESKKQEAKLKERNRQLKNTYYETLKDGRKCYDTNQFRQALEMYGKSLAYCCPEGDRSEKNGLSGCQEIREIQFIIGVCKIRAGVSEILDGMEMMKNFCSNESSFEAPAAAHYFLGIAYGKLCLNKMAQLESWECSTILKTTKSKAIRWPGSDDIFPESNPEQLKVLNEELNSMNKNPYPEEECIRVWRSLPLDSSITKRFDTYLEFCDKHNYMELIIKCSIDKVKREFLGMFSKGDDSYRYQDKLQHASGELLGLSTTLKPLPRAKCRFKDCLTTQGCAHAKEEIYDTDPDFKGFVDVICEECCTVTYHPCCWKAHKEQQEEKFGKMSDKDFLGTECVTPDCDGKITAILIHDETGCLKHELVANKKDKRNASTPVKQKKKKEKKKAQETKPQPQVKDKKKSKQESICEDGGQSEEPTASAAAAGPSTKPEPKTNNAPQNIDKEKVPSPVSNLPIDPESLDKVKVVIKPTVEEEPAPPSKTSKKKKKNKKPKETIQPDLLADPLDEETSATNEYVSRLRLLRQQREAQELDGENIPRATGSSEPFSAPLLDISKWLDPENPFYLPQHLRDNPEELERILQTKMIASTSPNLDNDTIKTLLDFVYDWLKSQGPMSINDDRLRKYISENFPAEALEHVNHCGGIKQFLMQSIDFAMIDEVICVRDHVVKAQELTKKTVTDRMMSSRFLISDGRKAKKFTHLLDDTKSSCSSSSSTSHMASSGLSLNSKTTTDSNVTAARLSTVEAIRTSLDHVIAKPKPKTESLGELDEFVTDVLKASAPLNIMKPSKIGGLDGLDTFETYEDFPRRDEESLKQLLEDVTSIGKKSKNNISSSTLNLLLKNRIFESQDSNDAEEEDEDQEEEEDEDEEEPEELPSPIDVNGEGSSVSANDMESHLKDEERDIITSNDGELYVSDEEEEVEDEEYEEDDDGEDDNMRLIEGLRKELYEMKQEMKMLTEQNQKLNDKLIQVKSTTGIEISSLKLKVEELMAAKRELEGEKQSLIATRENDAKKFKTEMSRMQEEVRSFQSRHSSLELKFERSRDHINEIDAKLIEEQEVSSQLREEVKNLQESLTSSSRRAHEAEVKYLCTKKDLVEAHLNRTIDRLTEEVLRMRQLLVHASDDSVPDRATLTRSIIAWDDSIKSLRDRKRVFMEDGKKLLGMVNQGRPLNALPPGDLEIPSIPDINVAPLLCITPGVVKSPVAAVVSEPPKEQKPPSSPSPALLPTPTVNGLSTLSLDPQKLFQLSSPGTQPSFVSGAIPKNTPINPLQSVVTTTSTCTVKATDGPITQKYPDSHKLFVGQIPWEFSELDVKNLFSDLIGEVVGVTVYDRGFTPDGKAVPKYGFVTFRNADDQEKALNYGPIMVGNHALNIQAKESKKPTKPTSLAVGGPTSVVSDPATLKNSSSAYGLSDISLNATLEANKSVVRTLSTPTLNQPSPPATTKPKFQNLTSTNNVGAIGTLPPKLVRPQPRQPAINGKSVSPATAPSKEDSVANTTSYKRLIEVCKQRVGKEFSSPEVCTALREVRVKNNNSLSGLNIDMIVERVKQQLRARRPGAGPATVAPWAGLTQGTGGLGGPEWQGPASGEIPPEEQCSICLEALITSTTVQLQCQHVFHEKCISGWLKRQSNCPNCRTFALMADEYPSLTH